jgi:hypothetical protein
VPPQSAVPAGQLHDPVAHTRPAGHTTPQPPQLVGSAAGSMQRVPQRRPAPGQRQPPARHESPAVHARPQAPQWAVLVWRSTQEVPQSVVPAGHWQTPDTQVCVAGHIVPAPQEGPPGHTLASVVPHATDESAVAGQRGAHSHTKVTGLHA